MVKGISLNPERQLNPPVTVVRMANDIVTEREIEALVASISMEVQSFMNHLPDMNGTLKELMKDVDWSIFDYQQHNSK